MKLVPEAKVQAAKHTVERMVAIAEESVSDFEKTFSATTSTEVLVSGHSLGRHAVYFHPENTHICEKWLNSHNLELT